MSRAYTPVLLLLSVGCIDTQLQAAATEGATNPDYVDFGTVAVGGLAAGQVSVDSIGRGALTVVSLTVQGVGGTSAFSIDGDHAGTSLPAGSSLMVPLLYAPTEAGWHEADLTVQTDANTGEPAFVVALRGRAAFPGLVVSPSSLDFGYVPPGSDPSLDVIVQATGELGGSIVAAGIDGDESFYLDDVEAPVSVLPGETARFSVGFGAPDLTAREAVLVLETDDPVLGTVRVPISGNACLGDAAEDADGDGFAQCAGDCDDTRADVNPAAEETADGEDDDCDGTTDEGTNAYDDDGDGYSEDAGDCADGDAAVSPGGVESANGVDDDCDGAVDDGTERYDDDGDGFTELGGDCDDADARTAPGAVERPDGLDQDCDGLVDEETSAGDDDGDGFDEASGDCDDGDAATMPGAAETANGVDDDCDGRVDEGTTAYDDDGDGYTEDGGDCDDAATAIGPHRLDTVGDGIDNDCDGVIR